MLVKDVPEVLVVVVLADMFEVELAAVLVVVRVVLEVLVLELLVDVLDMLLLDIEVL